MKGPLLVLSRKNDTKQCAALLNGPMRDQFLHMTDTLDDLMSWNRKQGESAGRQAQAAYTSARVSTLTLLALAILVGTFAGIFITRCITSTLTQISSRMGEAERDLHYQSGHSRCSFGAGRPDSQNCDRHNAAGHQHQG